MTPKTIAAFAFALAALPAAAVAWAPTSAAIATLTSGKPWTEVLADPQGATAQVHGVIDISASPAVVWSTVMDCAQMVKVSPSLKSCHVVQRDPKGHWMVREDISHAPLLPPIRVVLRSELDAPHGFTFKEVEGDMRVMEGGWRLEPLDGGQRTRVVYWTRMTPGLSIPAPLIRMVARSEAPKALIGLKTVSEATAREGTSKQ